MLHRSVVTIAITWDDEQVENPNEWAWNEMEWGVDANEIAIPCELIRCITDAHKPQPKVQEVEAIDVYGIDAGEMLYMNAEM